MLRRKFITRSLSAIPSVYFASLLSSCGKDDELTPIQTEKKVLIIGAGISGLAAAKYFNDRGVKVTVIEAQSQIGGRLKTSREDGLVFDEGASWIHGPNGNPISSLAEDAGAETFKTEDDSVIVFDIDGSLYDDQSLDPEEEAFNDILENMNGSISESFQDVFLQEYPQYQDNRLWKYMLSAYLEFDTGGDISQLSSQDFYDDESYEGDDVIITNGYDRIAMLLADGIQIEFNQKVYGIDYSENEIEVITDTDIFKADFVLITVPLGVLKADTISFTPGLPVSKTNAIEKLQMGVVNKFLCQWDESFWDVDLQYIGYTPEEKGKFNYFLNLKKFSGKNALMTFSFGDYSLETENMSDAAIISEIMKHLEAIYGNDIPQPVSFKRTMWGSNPYSLGAYSFVAKGSRSSDYDQFKIPVDNKLFFAGEHTSRNFRGTVHGAYLSGIREAESISQLL